MRKPLAVLGCSLAAAQICAPHADAAGCAEVKTVSGKVYCIIQDVKVVCWSQVGFQGSPSGQPDYLASVDNNGAFRWIYSGGLGSCGGTPTELAYGSNQTINAWDIQAAEFGTTFVSESSARGMFVSIGSTYGI
jgi:hypothetical protein